MDASRDPRTVVTPDAFSVSPALVGLPLAHPRTRLAAILVDLIVVALVSQLGWTLLGLVAAFYFFRMATSRSTGNVLSRAAQYSMGCAGAVILGVTIIVATGFIQDLFRDDRSATPAGIENEALGSVLGVVESSLALSSAETEEEAMSAAEDVVRVFLSLGDLDPAALAASLDQLVPANPDFDREALIERVVATAFPVDDPGLPSPDSAGATTVDLPLPDALDRYAELTRLRDSGGITTEQIQEERALRVRLRNELSGDSIASLNAQIDRLRSDVSETEEDLDAARQDAAAAEERRGFFAWVIDTADELGLAFGWGALYFSAILAWTNGLTPGKRLFGLRVVRLNGEPMTWFMAFERSGGYAAGFATGLLGFAQLLWDPNRMGIHDKIAETVVIRDRAPRIPGPWDAPAGGAPPRTPPLV